MNKALPWLAEPWRRAAAALESGRLPAGLLILGQPGLGRRLLAETIAAARLCPTAAPGADACGSCASCRQMAAGTHPDLLRVTPTSPGQALRVEQIRELGRALALTGGHRGARCAIIDPADRLTDPGANSLLKTLEEPPVGVTLILVAGGVAALPATVVSRCLRLTVGTPPRAQALAWLQERSPREDWATFLALAGGAPLAAMKLAETWPEDAQETVQALIQAAAGGVDPLTVAAACADWAPERLATVIAWLAHGGLRLRTGANAADDQWPPALHRLARRGDLRRLAQLWRAARALVADSRALNPVLARERLILLFVDAFAPLPAQG